MPVRSGIRAVLGTDPSDILRGCDPAAGGVLWVFESGEGEVQRAGVCVGGGAEELAFTSIHPCLVSPHATSRGSSVHI